MSGFVVTKEGVDEVLRRIENTLKRGAVYTLMFFGAVLIVAAYLAQVTTITDLDTAEYVASNVVGGAMLAVGGLIQLASSVNQTNAVRAISETRGSVVGDEFSKALAAGGEVTGAALAAIAEAHSKTGMHDEAEDELRKKAASLRKEADEIEGRLG